MEKIRLHIYTDVEEPKDATSLMETINLQKLNSPQKSQ